MKQDIWIKAGNGVLILLGAIIGYYLLKASYYITLLSFLFIAWVISDFGNHVASRNNDCNDRITEEKSIEILKSNLPITDYSNIDYLTENNKFDKLKTK